MADKKNEIKIRIDETVKILRDSPSCQATYVDIARVYELIDEIIGSNGKVGFERH